MSDKVHFADCDFTYDDVLADVKLYIDIWLEHGDARIAWQNLDDIVGDVIEAVEEYGYSTDEIDDVIEAVIDDYLAEMYGQREDEYAGKVDDLDD